jgi:hypothetical protein
VTGNAGSTGATGNAGSTGPTGATGAAGTGGSTGPTGPTGSASGLPFTGGSGSTFNYKITGTSGWPLFGMGLAANIPSQSFTYTPTTTQNLRVHFQGPVLQAAGNLGVRLNYGTGTAPGVNGTGGVPVPYALNLEGNATLFNNVYLFGILSNLAIGTTYWFDLAVNTSASGNVTLGNTTPSIPPVFAFEEF